MLRILWLCYPFSLHAAYRGIHFEIIFLSVLTFYAAVTNFHKFHHLKQQPPYYLTGLWVRSPAELTGNFAQGVTRLK